MLGPAFETLLTLLFFIGLPIAGLAFLGYRLGWWKKAARFYRECKKEEDRKRELANLIKEEDDRLLEEIKEMERADEARNAQNLREAIRELRRGPEEGSDETQNR